LAVRLGPVLGDLKGRVNAEWVAAFLADPQKVKAGTMMPGMFEGLDEKEKAVQVEAVTHYLMSLRPAGKAAKPKVPKHSNAERGSAVFHQVGCVACHAPTADFHPAAGAPKAEEFTSRPVPLPDVKAKYSVLSLAAFLEAPDKVRVDGRMPHLGLSNEDAMDIACHLMDFRPSDPREAAGLKGFTVDAAKAKVGGEVVAKMNCAACHDLGGKEKPAVATVALKAKAGGCLSGKGGAKYELSEVQVAALELYLKGEPELAVAERADLTLKAFNCVACHDRDSVGGPDVARNRYFVGDEGIADAGRLAPPLTGIGRKLRPEWMESVFKGAGRVRPYVKTRMPVYAAQAKGLTKVLTEADEKVLPAMLAGDLEAGHKLLGIAGGVNCITCHVWGEKPSLGIQALDISELDKRLRPEWFREYLLNPAGYRPGTLMPPLWPGGVSMVKDVLGGDAEKQIASIWEFIAKGEGPPEGYPEHVTGAFELVPKDRPIVQRTFLNEVGPYAILAGFPGGLNLAYDGEKGRPALAWRGRFFDAYSTWFVRAAPFEDPLEKEVFAWAKGSDGETGAFGGYKLDAGGNPTFLVTVDGVAVEDRYEVVEGTLRRTVAWEAGAKEPGWSHPAGLAMTEAKGAKANQRVFVYSWK
jgi:mono/diheme cytochrome c family protein